MGSKINVNYIKFLCNTYKKEWLCFKVALITALCGLRPMTANAAAGERVQGRNNAIIDILENPRFQGALESIDWLVGIADVISTAVISFVGFFIIWAAMGRVSIAGAYSAFPKLFDKVHYYKELGMQAVDAVGNRVPGGKVVSLPFKLLLALIPDFKALSDFEEGVISPREWFKKAIPMAILACMMGAAIFNAYTRDLIVKAVDLGSEMICRVIYRVDLVEYWDRFTNSVSDPGFDSESDVSDEGQLIADISTKVYKKLISYYTDVDTLEAKSKLSASIEEWVTTCVRADAGNYTNTDEWTPTIDVRRVSSQPNLSNVIKTEDDMVIRAWSRGRDEFDIDSGEHKEDTLFIKVIVRFDRVHNGVTSAKRLSNLKLVIPADKSSPEKSSSGSKDSTVIGPLEKGGMLTASGNVTVTVSGKSYTASVNKDADTLTIKGIAIEDGTTVSVNNLFYRDNTNSTHKIAEIELSKSASSSTFTDRNGAVSDFAYGADPVIEGKKDGSGAETTKETNKESED